MSLRRRTAQTQFLHRPSSTRSSSPSFFFLDSSLRFFDAVTLLSALSCLDFSSYSPSLASKYSPRTSTPYSRCSLSSLSLPSPSRPSPSATVWLFLGLLSLTVTRKVILRTTKCIMSVTWLSRARPSTIRLSSICAAIPCSPRRRSRRIVTPAATLPTSLRMTATATSPHLLLPLPRLTHLHLHLRLPRLLPPLLP